eukprot:14600-Heterococcus_DN1.PRE.1
MLLKKPSLAAASGLQSMLGCIDYTMTVLTQHDVCYDCVISCPMLPFQSGCLTPWCEQGVLLLNTVLTVEKGQAMSHRKQGWEQFSDAVIRQLNKSERPIVFLLWGKPSQEKGSSINKSLHKVITCSHPSPLGATKTSEPFIGSNCFAKANDALVKWGQTPIDWNI